MSTIWEIVEDALADLDVPVAANVMISATGSELPDVYLVYQLISSPPEQHADDLEAARSYRMQVSAYSRDGLVGLPNVDAAMVAAGFSKSGKVELPYNPQTRHFGLAQDYILLTIGEDDGY